MSNPNLGPQFFEHERLGSLNASDYKGTVAEGTAPMERWHGLFGGTTEGRPYDDGVTPTSHVESLRADIRERGVQHPITAVDYSDDPDAASLGIRIRDGHHRAVAAYLEGQGAPVEVLSSRAYAKRRFNL